MTILDLIVTDKAREVRLKKSLIPVKQLEQSLLFEKTTRSMSESIRNSKTGIIAEHKRRSPSKPNINLNLSVDDVVMGYEKAKVSGISVLTDAKYFGGSLEDLIQARSTCQKPLLRKDFMIDEYQILEAKAHGADTILLIAATLKTQEVKHYSELAQSLGMEVLLEIHNKEELDRTLMPSVNLVGVNNRNLKTFEVSLETSLNLVENIPNDFVRISESGLSEVAAVQSLKAAGYDGFLMGEHFMKTENPGLAAKNFIDAI